MADPPTDVVEQQKTAAAAVRKKDITQTEGWSDLSEISPNPLVENLEIFADEIIFNDDRFSGPILWHVTITSGTGQDAFTLSESFPGIFEGEIKSGEAVITRITADTSSFYE